VSAPWAKIHAREASSSTETIFPGNKDAQGRSIGDSKNGGVAQQWRVSNINIATGTLATIKLENSETIVDETWFVFDANSGSLFLQRLGFFGDMALKRTTNSYKVWRDILNPEKMMDGEALMVLLEWTIYGFSCEKKLVLLASQSKTWLADRSFWQSWVKEIEPQHIPPFKCIKWVCMKEEPVWGNEVVNDKSSTALDTCFSGQTVAALGFIDVSQQSRDIPLMRADLPKRHVTSSALQGLQHMSNDYIKSKAGFYMTLEGFSNSRKCKRTVAKIQFPVPFHLLDHVIIPINIRESHWFPAHMDVTFRRMSFLDSSYAYSTADYGRKCSCGNFLQNRMDSPR